MRGRFRYATGVLASTALIASCGTRVPEIKEVGDGLDGTVRMEFEIKRRVYCDLRDAVQSVNQDIQFYMEDRATGRKSKTQFVPNDWGAQVSLSLQVDESSSLNPSLLVTKVKNNYVKGDLANPVAQAITLGAGATISATATRTDRFNPYYSVEHLMKPDTADSPCIPGNDPFIKNGAKRSRSSPLIVSDLGIKRWLGDAMFTNSLLFSQNPGGAPGNVTPDTITLEIKFVIVSAGNISPTWRLIPVSVNNSALPLFASSRTRTHGLIITIGPPKNETSQAHFAAQLGQAINTANPPRF